MAPTPPGAAPTAEPGLLRGRAEVVRALGALCEPPGAEHGRLGELLELPGVPAPAAHTAFFGMELYPYASVYLGAEGMLGGEAADRVAGFWRALGLDPPAEPDHLAALLGLYAALLEGEAAEPAGPPAAARGALLWEHLLPWLDPWLERARELAPEFYAGWAARLEGLLAAELARAEPPARPPLHLREAPRLPDPRAAGGDAFVQGVLAACRSGMILVRADLRRGARRLGLGLRLGERAYALRAFMGQDPGVTLGWLAAEAEAASGRHAARATRGDSGAPISAWWARRARAAAELLEELATEGRAAAPGPAAR